VLVELAYGVEGRSVEVPDDATVIEPVDQPGLGDQQGAVRQALEHPLAGPSLAELAAGARRVVVVFPDLTRPMPATPARSPGAQRGSGQQRDAALRHGDPSPGDAG